MTIKFDTLPAEKIVEIFKLSNHFGQVQPWEMQLIRDVDWSTMEHRYLTCVRHPWVRYVTKNPFERSIHFLQGIHGMSFMFDEECDCPFTDLRVVK